VKPAPFGYHRPATVAEAVALLDALRDDVKVLAGGQSLVPLMNFRLSVPAELVDINGIAELTGLPQSLIEERNLRISDQCYFKEALRSRRGQ